METKIYTPTDWTVRQASQILQISIHSVRDLINSGALKHYKISARGTRITTAQLDQFRNSGGV